ncbi:MAG TPA: family 10 glycosylhydrolase [Firmicutes bacterium]|nr:family 10 glycosylhydrolase [Bacillota bacterium]
MLKIGTRAVVVVVVAVVALVTVASAAEPARYSLPPLSSSQLVSLPGALRQRALLDEGRLQQAARLLAEAEFQVMVGAVSREDLVRASEIWTGLAQVWSRLARRPSPAREEWEEGLAEIESVLPELWRLIIPSRSVEVRILPVDASSLSRAYLNDDIDFIVRMAKAAGFNTIFVETLRDDGYLVYRSSFGVEAPDLAAKHGQEGEDALATFLAAAHEEGLAVFPWVKLLFATANGELGPVLSQHPEWAAVASDGKIPTTPYNLVWFNPAHPGVREFLTNSAAELAANYPIDGVQLDYVRYPNQYGVDTDYSYDDYTVEQVKMLYGFDPRTLPRPRLGDMGSAGYRVGDLPQAMQEWNAYREEMVSSLLGRVVKAIHEKRPGIPISVAPLVANWGGGTLPQALVVHQNWPVWLERHLALLLSPLTYSGDPRVVQRELGNVVELAAGRAMVAPSLSIQQVDIAGEGPGLGAVELLREVDVVQQGGGVGYRIFAFPHLKAEHWRALAKGAFRRPATNPVVEPAAAARQLVEEAKLLLKGLQEAGFEKEVARWGAQVERLAQYTSPERLGGRQEPGPQGRQEALTWATLAAQTGSWLEQVRTTWTAEAEGERARAARAVLERTLLELQALASAMAYQGRPVSRGW